MNTSSGDCQKFNAIYKYLQRKSGENETDLVETAKLNFHKADFSSNGEKFTLFTQVCLEKYPKWDMAEPLDSVDHTKLFGPDARPRPAIKPRPAKKPNQRRLGRARWN
ncbi:hypothetical protein Tco_1491950 [Tanacetum coccineum]